jgi:hypothetical protein
LTNRNEIGELWKTSPSSRHSAATLMIASAASMWRPSIGTPISEE